MKTILISELLEPKELKKFDRILTYLAVNGSTNEYMLEKKLKPKIVRTTIRRIMNKSKPSELFITTKGKRKSKNHSVTFKGSLYLYNKKLLKSIQEVSQGFVYLEKELSKDYKVKTSHDFPNELIAKAYFKTITENINELLQTNFLYMSEKELLEKFSIKYAISLGKIKSLAMKEIDIIMKIKPTKRTQKQKEKITKFKHYLCSSNYQQSIKIWENEILNREKEIKKEKEELEGIQKLIKSFEQNKIR